MNSNNILHQAVESLDLYITSPGGVGSNYLRDFLHDKGLKTKTTERIDALICHSTSLRSKSTPTLCIYSEEPEALISQYRRNILSLNCNKIHFDRDSRAANLPYFVEKFPEDPCGVIKHRESWESYAAQNENIVMLEYPYTSESVHHALDKLKVEVDLSGFSYRKRKSKLIEVQSLPDILQTIINIYKK